MVLTAAMAAVGWIGARGILAAIIAGLATGVLLALLRLL